MSRLNLRVPRPTTTTAALLVIIASLVVLAAVIVMPSPPRLSDETTGDPALADALREAAGDRGYRGLAVALVEDGTVRTAGLGSTGGPDARPIHEHTPFEIGSIGKGLTGMLLADSGLDPATPLAALLPDVRFDDVDVANASLEELTSHRSGLPRLRITITSFARSWLAGVLGTDPYRGDTAQSVLDDVAAASSSGPSGMSYSNLGVAVLGLALAEEAGQPYPDLLDERILQPLGMTDTMFASQEDELPEGRAHGVRANGLPADPWLERGWGGAGLGLWSTSSDLARLMSALIDGSAPGADATTPRFDSDEEGERIGYGWFTDSVEGREITWHNGATGGFHAWLGFDEDAGIGVVVLGNSDRSVDHVGRRLLGLTASAPSPSIVMMIVTVVLSVGAGAMLFANRNPDRLSLVSDAAYGTLMLALVRSVGVWDAIPPVVWLLGAAGLIAGVVIVGARWSELPTRRTGHPLARAVGTGVPVALCLAYFVALGLA